eukprot:gene10647-2845_t
MYADATCTIPADLVSNTSWPWHDQIEGVTWVKPAYNDYPYFLGSSKRNWPKDWSNSNTSHYTAGDDEGDVSDGGDGQSAGTATRT